MVWKMYKYLFIIKVLESHERLLFIIIVIFLLVVLLYFFLYTFFHKLGFRFNALIKTDTILMILKF